MQVIKEWAIKFVIEPKVHHITTKLDSLMMLLNSVHFTVYLS